MSKASDKFISEAEEKLTTGRYTAQEFLQILFHVTEESFEKMADDEKNQGNSELLCGGISSESISGITPKAT